LRGAQAALHQRAVIRPPERQRRFEIAGRRAHAQRETFPGLGLEAPGRLRGQGIDGAKTILQGSEHLGRRLRRGGGLEPQAIGQSQGALVAGDQHGVHPGQRQGQRAGRQGVRRPRRSRQGRDQAAVRGHQRDLCRQQPAQAGERQRNALAGFRLERPEMGDRSFGELTGNRLFSHQDAALRQNRRLGVQQIEFQRVGAVRRARIAGTNNRQRVRSARR